MRHLRNYLAITGAHYLLYSIGKGVIRSRRDLHARWINRLQAEVAMELDLYENRWGKSGE